MQDYVPILTGIIGIIVGAILQYILTRRMNRLSEFDPIRSQAYVDFIKGVTQVSTAQSFENTDAERIASSQLHEAKVKIGMGLSYMNMIIKGKSRICDDLARHHMPRMDTIAFKNGYMAIG